MKIFRQLSTPRLIALVAALIASCVAAGVGSMAAFGSSAATPPPKPLDQAVEDAVAAAQPAGITARVQFTNNLFPSGSLSGVTGSQGSALVSGGSGRLWWSPDGRGRLELQSDSGDTQVLWDHGAVTVWDSSSNIVYKFSLPSRQGTNDEATGQPPALADIDSFLKRIAAQVDVGTADPTSLAGRPAYSVTVSPAHSAGLVGSLQLAWDAEHGVPLEIALRAQGQSTPALALTVTDIGFGAIADSDLTITPPASAKTVELGQQSGGASGQSGSGQQVSGLDAVQAAVPFQLVAPDTLVGLPRQSVQLLDGKDKGALVLYGHGLGGIALVEHAAGDGGSSQSSSLPKVAIGSATGHELATQLGTVLFFDDNGVSVVLAGSMPPAAAEAAARSLG
jgi:hypothetical protein